MWEPSDRFQKRGPRQIERDLADPSILDKSAWVSKITDQDFAARIPDLLTHVFNTFPQAFVIITSYYQIVSQKYDALFMQWVAQNGGGDAGTTIAAKSVQADYDASYMAWFAHQFAFQNDAKGIVMGHTHIPKVGIVQSWCQYMNSGFECPAIPDIRAGRTHWNFTTIAQDGTMQLMQVVYAHTSVWKTASTSCVPLDAGTLPTAILLITG